jgi:hypothetical protein
MRPSLQLIGEVHAVKIERKEEPLLFFGINLGPQAMSMED